MKGIFNNGKEIEIIRYEKTNTSNKNLTLSGHDNLIRLTVGSEWEEEEIKELFSEDNKELTLINSSGDKVVLKDMSFLSFEHVLTDFENTKRVMIGV